MIKPGLGCTPEEVREYVEWLDSVGGLASDKTLRDYFAGQALIGLITKSPYYKADLNKPEEMDAIQRRYKSISLSAYFIADAMIEARRG